MTRTLRVKSRSFQSAATLCVNCSCTVRPTMRLVQFSTSSVKEEPPQRSVFQIAEFQSAPETDHESVSETVEAPASTTAETPTEPVASFR